MLKGIEEEATYYYHPDHLGSVSVVSNHQGVPYERVEYLPFGEVWIEDVDPATRYIPFRFTSKELDRETGLYYYGARYYEPKVSRWMSADPAGFALVNPMDEDGEPVPNGWPEGFGPGPSVGMRPGYSVVEAVNWYAYVSNNPVKYVDPTGEAEIYSRRMNAGNNKWLAAGNALGFEHYLFRGGKRYQRTNAFAIFHFLEAGGKSKVSQYESFSPPGDRYRIIYSGLDDELAEKAANEIAKSDRFKGDDTYKVLKNDCKDFTQAIMERYEELWKERALKENKNEEKFNVNKAWRKHRRDITSRRGEIVEYNDLNKDELPKSEQ